MGDMVEIEAARLAGLKARLAYLQIERRSDRAKLLEQTASRMLPVIYAGGAKLTRQEAAQRAIERAAVLVDELDAHFEG